MISLNGDAIMSTCIFTWFIAIVFSLILIFSTLSILGLFVCLFIWGLCLTIALISTFLSIVDLDDLMDWFKERKISKFKGEN